MPQLFRKVDAALDMAETWFRFYYPVGSDIKATCAANGWADQMPAGVLVLDEKGAVIQEGPASVPEAAPQSEKPAKEAK